jgi:hypothetical protein
MQTYRRIGVTKLTAVFRTFADAAKNYFHTADMLFYFLQNSREEFSYPAKEVISCFI